MSHVYCGLYNLYVCDQSIVSLKYDIDVMHLSVYIYITTDHENLIIIISQYVGDLHISMLLLVHMNLRNCNT